MTIEDEDASMADPTADFLQDYQSLARQTWEAWLRQLQPPAAPAGATHGHAGAAPANEALERTLDGVRGYLDWMQGTMAGAAVPGADWQHQLQQWFGQANLPFAQAFAGIDGAGAQGFAQQWQAWMQAAQRSGMAPGPGTGAPIPALGLDREQQMQQQELAQAMLAAAQAAARYQTLLQRAGAEGMQRLQDKLAEHAEPGRQIESLKGLYDLWVDAAEEAYADIALTDEFRAVYGDMVNTQMRVRQLQRKYTEAMCQQLGMPTRSEVSSLGKRLQELRREMRAAAAARDASAAGAGIEALRRELAELKRRLGRPAGDAPASAGRAASARAAAKPRRQPSSRAPGVAAAAKSPPRGGRAAGKQAGAGKAAARRTPPARAAASAKAARRPSAKRK